MRASYAETKALDKAGYWRDHSLAPSFCATDGMAQSALHVLAGTSTHCMSTPGLNRGVASSLEFIKSKLVQGEISFFSDAHRTPPEY